MHDHHHNPDQTNAIAEIRARFTSQQAPQLGFRCAAKPTSATPRKTKVRVNLAGDSVILAVDRSPPLGWRFWTFAGFPSDPVEPRPYGGTRGVVLDVTASGLFAVAMELDGSARLFTSHELFPCGDQSGANEFANAWIDAHEIQPDLFA